MSEAGTGWVLWLFVINLGAAFGAGLYEHRVVWPRWFTAAAGDSGHWHAAAARADDPGRRFWAGVSTVPLTLLTLASLAAAWAGDTPADHWWRAAAVTALAERACTFGYFIPAMVRLMRSDDSAAAVAAAGRWAGLNLLRHGLVLAAWLAALQALVRRY